MIDEAQLQEFVGRTAQEENVVTAFPAQALIATLGRDEATPQEGEPIPPGWHELYFASTPKAGTLTEEASPLRRA